MFTLFFIPLYKHTTLFVCSPPPPTPQSPSGPSQWVVLADYNGAEPGMLSVSEGDVVHVLELSSNQWCLVRTTSHPPADGWVPTAYLCPPEGLGGRTSPFRRRRSFSSSEESDTPTELSENSALMSPEVLEAYEDEEQRAEAEEKRM